MVSDLAVAHSHHVDRFEMNFAMRRSNSQERAVVRAMVSLVGRHTVAVCELPVNLRMKVRKAPRACQCRTFERPPYRAWFQVEWCDRRNRRRRVRRTHRSFLSLGPLRYFGGRQLLLHLMLSRSSYSEAFCACCFARAIGWLYFSEDHA